MRLRLSLLCLCALAWTAQCGTSSSNPAPDGGNAADASAGTGGTVSSGGGSGTGGAANTGGTGAGGAQSTGGAANTGGVNPLSPCDALKLDASVQDAGRDVDRFTWRDSRCEPRVASMVRAHNGYLRQYKYRVDGSDRVCTGTGVNGWDGFGYAVAHHPGPSGASISKNATPGKFGPVFVGRHHAIYEYQFIMGFDGPTVPVTVHWMFATGRDHPVYAITYDLSAHPPDTVRGDSRSPYGDMFFEGEVTQPSTIAGVGWGDRYKFVTTTAPLSMNSEWDYTELNSIPYAFEWTASPDAEMGLVQTAWNDYHAAGGYQFFKNWERTSANQVRETGPQIGNMPPGWTWTYQINQYELCETNADCVNNTTTSHRLAWGMNYGAVGGDGSGLPGTYNVYGDDRRVPGHPYQSYSVFVVLGKHSDGAVAQHVQDVLKLTHASLSARLGSITTKVPAGVGRTDTVEVPGGYDARYAMWSAAMSGGVLEFQTSATAGMAPMPVLAVTGYNKLGSPSVTIDGREGEADRDFYASVDEARKTVWLTFPGGWAAGQSILVR